MYSFIGSIDFHVPFLVRLGFAAVKGEATRTQRTCIHVHLHAFVLACLFLAVVICIGSVIILFRELVAIAPQYVLEAGHAL